MLRCLNQFLEAFELREGSWLPSTSAKDDVPASIHLFDVITFILDDLWPGVDLR